MSVIALIGTFLYVLKEILILIPPLISFVHQKEEMAARKKMASDIRAGIKEAISSGNTSKLEAVFNGGAPRELPPAPPGVPGPKTSS